MRESLGAVLLGVLCGCGSLQVKLVDAAHRRPSNVAVYFSVDTSEGEPVGGLQASDFEIYEDGGRVSVHESKQTILNPKVAAAHYTLLLVDMSASVREMEQVPMITDAARQFVAELSGHQRVAVYAFDGSPSLHRIQGFSSAKQTVRALDRLERFSSKDPSTNLHGAVREALQALDKGLDQPKEPLRFGTLVVFTDGTDRAGRVSAQQLDETIAGTELDIFAIGVGSEIDEGTLARVGVNGYVLVQDASALREAFRTISSRIVDFTQRYYLLSYCSPARAGTHEVTIRAVNPEGGATGRLRYSFDAKGFKPHCNPDRAPPFDTSGRKYGTVRRGGAPRGLRLQVATASAADTQIVDPELGDSAQSTDAPKDVSPAERVPPPVDLEALENELPPGLQPKKEGEDEPED